jgi:hypothetical protein
MKTYLLLFLAVFSCSCLKKTKVTFVERPDTKPIVAKVSAELLITPGLAIGNTALEENTSKLEVLGKPDASDAAMGKAWMTWYGKKADRATIKKDELNIYTTYKDNELKEKVVRQIRVTSTDFKTKEGINTESTFEEIRNFYPNIKLVGKYNHIDSKIEVTIYDDVASGIAFEVENPYGSRHCSAIIVHTKGKKVTDEYIGLNPYIIVL